jgi:ribosome recycling factor
MNDCILFDQYEYLKDLDQEQRKELYLIYKEYEKYHKQELKNFLNDANIEIKQIINQIRSKDNI